MKKSKSVVASSIGLMPCQGAEGPIDLPRGDGAERGGADVSGGRGEDPFRTLVEKMDEGFCVVEMLRDRDGRAVDYRFTAINPAFERHTGLRDAMGRTIREMVPDHDAHWFEIYGEVARTGRSVRFENPAVAMGRFYEVFAFRIGGDGSERVGILFKDVSEHRKTDDALQQSITRLRRFFDLPLVGVGISSPTKSWLDVNEHLCSMLGYGRTELQSLTWADLTHRDDLGADLEQFERVLRGEIDQYSMEKRFVRKDGTIIFVDWSVGCVRKTDGSVDYLVALVHDISKRKRAEKALQASEEDFRYVFENSVIGKSITLPSGEIRANRAFAEMLGYELEQLAQVNWRELTHPEDVQETQRALAPIFSGERDNSHFMKRYLHRSGSIVWAEVWTSVRRDASGAPAYFMTSVVDITERRRTEEALRESQAILAAAMNQSPVGIAIADAPDGTLRYVNDAGLLIGGGTREAIVEGVGIDQYVASWHLLDLDGEPLSPDEVPMTRAIRFGEVSVREFVVRRNGDDDRVVLANAAPVRDALGRVTAGVAVFTDITDRKRMEDAIRRREEEIRALNQDLEKRVAERTAELAKNRWLLDETSRLSQVGGWEVDLRKNEMTWTDVTYEIHEIEKGSPQTVEQGINYYAPESIPRITEVFQRAVGTGEPYDEELELITARGRRKWVRAIGFADLEDGKVVRVHGLFQDIQAQKERMLKLEEANREMASFTHSVSHDLRAPLRHLIGFVELLNRRRLEGLDEKNLHYLTVISEAARTMGQLLEDLLSFSRMGKVPMAPSEIDMNLLVSKALEVLGPEMAGRDVDLRISDLPRVVGDQSMMSLVLQNLLSNALKYSRSRPRAVVEVGCDRRGDREDAFFVKDNGVGFDMRYVDKLFGIFQRLHSTEEFEGTGVGLANVRRIITRHGGRTWAEGVVGEGATFYFSVPRQEKEREQ